MGVMKFTQKIEFVSSQSRFFYQLLSLYYRFIVRKEVLLGKVTDRDCVLCIGGGACPYTGILLAQYTNADVTVIDNDASCAVQAKKLISRLGIPNIRIICDDGADISYESYSVIHVALQITPKEEVLETIQRRADSGTRVLIRNPKPILDSLYCPCKQEAHSAGHVSYGGLTNLDNTTLQVVA